MEQPRKLMATPNQDSVHDHGDVDRFTGLPDSTVHHILSFLTVKDLALLSFASRRCQELCHSSPTLSLSNTNLKPDDILCRLSFNTFLQSLMLHRCSHGVKMQTLSLRWSFKQSPPDEEYRVGSLLQHAVHSGVQLLNLDVIGDGKPFALPVCVLGCESLRSLVVNANNGFLKFPSTLSCCYASSTLRVLILESVCMGNDYFQQWFSSLKSLKVLALSRVSGIKSMTITSSSIEKLRITCDDDLCHVHIQQLEKLHDLHISWRVKSSGSKSMQISAPNLRRFFWEGHAVDYFCMRSSPHLWQAALGLSPPADQPTGRKKADHKDNFDKVLCSIQSAKNLTLRIEFVEVLLKHGCLPFLFDNLECLTVQRSTHVSGNQVKALSSLLRGTTKLKNLILSRTHLIVPNPKNSAACDITMINSMPSKQFPFDMENWESQDLMFTHQVKKISMEFCNDENELELAEYLVQSGKELEELTIIYSSPLPPYFIPELGKYKKPFTRLHLQPKLHL